MEPMVPKKAAAKGRKSRRGRNVRKAPQDMSKLLKRLDDIGHSLIKLSTELKHCIEEVKTVNTKQVERYEQERAAAAIIAAGPLDPQVEAEHVPLHNVEESESKTCANCNRDASAECSLCRRTPYCSTYCQKKDWAAHQIECFRSVPNLHNESQQSIMLIVESQPQ